MKGDILARIGFKSGVVEISEDVLCKHTIFIGSTAAVLVSFQTVRKEYRLMWRSPRRDTL